MAMIKVIYFPHGVMSLNSEFFPCKKSILKGIFEIALMDDTEWMNNIENLFSLLRVAQNTSCSPKDITKIKANIGYLYELSFKHGYNPDRELEEDLL